VVAREGLDSQMYPLVSLQVVVPIEALGTLVALEWSVIGGWLLVRRMAKEVRHCRRVSTVEAWHHTRMYAYKGKLAVWILNVREHRSRTWLIC
jgi:hypothetical protein